MSYTSCVCTYPSGVSFAEVPKPDQISVPSHTDVIRHRKDDRFGLKYFTFAGLQKSNSSHFLKRLNTKMGLDPFSHVSAGLCC